MKRLLLAAILVTVFIGAGSAWAGPKDPGYYLGIRFNGGIAEVDNASNDSTTGPAVGASLINPSDDDLTANASALFGYIWRAIPIRTEFEYTHVFRFDYDAPTVASGVNAGYKANVDSDLFLINAYYDFDTGTSFYPWVGGGAGYGRNNTEGEFRFLTSSVTQERSDSTDNFVWHVGLGVNWAFAENWDAEVAFRYLDLGDIQTGPFSNGLEFSFEDYTSKDVILGLRYRF